jgi:hypothetical protein
MEKMEQMMESLLAKIDVTRKKMVSQHEEIMADMRAWRKEIKADREATQENPDNRQELEEGSGAGDREAKIRAFSQDSKNG